jgi:hypothetical protein
MTRMQTRVGFEMEYQCRDAMPMILACRWWATSG